MCDDTQASLLSSSLETSLLRGRLCGPIMNFDTPKGGAVCVGDEQLKDPARDSDPSEKNPWKRWEPAGNWKSCEFPCRVHAHGERPRGGVEGGGGSVSGYRLEAAREMFEAARRRLLRGLEYVRRQLV